MIKLVGRQEFITQCEKRRIVLIGAGRQAVTFMSEYDWNYAFAIDNSIEKQREMLKAETKAIPIKDWQYLRQNVSNGDVLIITPGKCMDLIRMTEDDECLRDIDTYVLIFIRAIEWDIEKIRVSNMPYSITKGCHTVIPKTIHYFWFSDDPYPEKVQRCIDSWHKYCPDYEFRKWDLTNYKTDNVFCNEALSIGEWAAASDYGRCDVIYRYGGIYLDCDVELVRPLDDLLYDEGFFCFESIRGGIDPGSGMGCVKNHPDFGRIRQQYEGVHCIREDGSFDRISIQKKYTSVFTERGLNVNGEYQLIDNIAIYPPLLFNSYSYMTGIQYNYEKAYGIHHCMSAYLTEDARREYDFRTEYISNYARTISALAQYIDIRTI